MKKLILFNITLVTLMLITFQNSSFSAENQKIITLTSKISNASNNITNTFTYKIEPFNENPDSTEMDNKIIEICFNKTQPNEVNEAIKAFDIDFSDISFNKVGTYKYKISEINSSNNEEFPTSNEIFEIYVQVVFDENNRQKLVPRVYSQAVDIKTGDKTDLNFNHEPHLETTEGKSKAPKTGIIINVLPFIILLTAGIWGIVLIKKLKRIEEEFDNYENIE